MTNSAIVITNRDLDILMWVYSSHGATPDHIRRRFFPTNGARSACYARLARLIKAGYLVSVRLPSFNGKGSGREFVTPGPEARPLLAKALGLSRTELGRLRMDAPLFIHHHTGLLDVRLALEIASEMSPVFTLQEWIGDHELRHAPIRVTDPETKKAISFVPDASFTLVLPDGSEQTFHLELDLATLSPKRCREKCRAYLLDSVHALVPVLFVTTDQGRCDALARYAQEETERLKADPTVFWLTTKDRISEKTILDQPIWRIVGGPASTSLTTMAGVDPQEVPLESLVAGSNRPITPSGSLFFAGALRA